VLPIRKWRESLRDLRRLDVVGAIFGVWCGLGVACGGGCFDGMRRLVKFEVWHVKLERANEVSKLGFGVVGRCLDLP